MVVPRLTAPEFPRPASVLVASTPAAKHRLPPPVPDLRAWTEQEWAEHARNIGDPEEKTAPHWVLSLFGTLVILFVLRINHAGMWPILVCLLLGAVLSGILIARDRKSTGAYSLVRGLGIVLALCFFLPVVALAVLFIGCMGCR